MAANINELRALTPPEGNLEGSERFYTMGQDTIIAR